MNAVALLVTMSSPSGLLGRDELTRTGPPLTRSPWFVRQARALSSAATAVRDAVGSASRLNGTQALVCSSSPGLGVGPCANADPLHLNRRPSVRTNSHWLTVWEFALEVLDEQLEDVT